MLINHIYLKFNKKSWSIIFKSKDQTFGILKSYKLEV